MKNNKKVLLVSACLLGVNCKYSGGNNLKNEILNKIKDVQIIPICPEQLGGLSTPRLPSEIEDGTGADVLNGKARVIDKSGKDVTSAFVKGAEEALRLCKLYACDMAILKSRSPSCGIGYIYDGSFSGQLKKGVGVCAQLLKDNNVMVYNEDNYMEGDETK